MDKKTIFYYLSTLSPDNQNKILLRIKLIQLKLL